MKVSIIIPCYQLAHYLGEAIESALEQTYPHKEIIVINDGSPDNTSEVASRYPVQLIEQSNRGLPGARNAGIMRATGEAILPLDADDHIDPTYLSKTVPKLIEDERVGVVHTDLETFGKKVQLCKPAETIELDRLKESNQLWGTSLVRKEVILECGGYNTRLIHGYEDWDLWIDICKRGWKFVYVPEPLLKYRLKEVYESMDKIAIIHWHKWNVEQIRKNHPDIFGSDMSKEVPGPWMLR